MKINKFKPIPIDRQLIHYIIMVDRSHHMMKYDVDSIIQKILSKSNSLINIINYANTESHVVKRLNVDEGISVSEVLPLSDAIELVKNLTEVGKELNYTSTRLVVISDTLFLSSNMDEISNYNSIINSLDLNKKVILYLSDQNLNLLNELNFECQDITKFEIEESLYQIANIPDNLGIFSLKDNNLKFYSNNDFCNNDEEFYYISDEGTKDSYSLELQYAAVATLLHNNHRQLACRVLNKIGDVRLIDLLSLSLTFADRLNFIDNICECISSPEVRFLEGMKIGYLPRYDQLCFLNFVNLINKDPESYIYIDSDFKYNIIGPKFERKLGFNKFILNPQSKCRLKFEWSNNLLNCNINCRLRGKVRLAKNIEIDGVKQRKPDIIEDVIYTHMLKTFTVVKDGMYNISSIKISASHRTLVTLYKAGLIDEVDVTKIYTINLNNIPLLNGRLLNSPIKVETFAKLLHQELIQKIRKKVLKYLKNKDKTEDNDLTTYDKYLRAYGITENGYVPKSNRITTGYYYPVEFSTYFKKFSSIPSIDGVFDKVFSNKKLTDSENLLYKIYDNIINELNTNDIEYLIKECDKRLNYIKSRITRLKILYLYKGKFDDLDLFTGEQVISFGDLSLVLKIRRIPYDI